MNSKARFHRSMLQTRFAACGLVFALTTACTAEEQASTTASSVVASDLDAKLTANRAFVQVSLGDVQRLEMVARTSSITSILDRLEGAGLDLDVDGYSRVYMDVPWTSKKIDGYFEEFSWVILEFKGNESSLRSILDGAKANVDSYTIAAAKRGMITLKGDQAGRNPNPAKWYNREEPATSNYRENLSKALGMVDARAQPNAADILEVNSPMNTDDVGALAAELRRAFPAVEVAAVDVGVEHFIDDKGKDFSYPTMRVGFDVSRVKDTERLRLLEVVEYLHSYKVPVMRFVRR